MVRFSYRVLDAENGKVLKRQESHPLLFDHKQPEPNWWFQRWKKLGSCANLLSPEIGLGILDGFFE